MNNHDIKELEKKLWQAADKLRNGLDAAEYKHVVLGLIFLKYISDAFNERRTQLKKHFANPQHERYLGKKTSDEDVKRELEDRDYYIEKNVLYILSNLNIINYSECDYFNFLSSFPPIFDLTPFKSSFLAKAIIP